MVNQVGQLIKKVEVIGQRIKKIQNKCKHKMVSLGLASEGPGSGLRKIPSQLRPNLEDDYYEPTSSFKSKGDLFSTPGHGFVFYVICQKCGLIKHRYLHKICIFCLCPLGETTREGNYCEKKCSKCKTKFGWLTNDDE